jgi:hypothetical protein
VSTHLPSHHTRKLHEQSPDAPHTLCQHTPLAAAPFAPHVCTSRVHTRQGPPRAPHASCSIASGKHNPATLHPSKSTCAVGINSTHAAHMPCKTKGPAHTGALSVYTQSYRCTRTKDAAVPCLCAPQTHSRHMRRFAHSHVRSCMNSVGSPVTVMRVPGVYCSTPVRPQHNAGRLLPR